MSGDLARKDVTPVPKPERKRKAAPKRRKVDLETSAAWHQAVLHKRDAALWAAQEREEYELVAGPGLPLFTDADGAVLIDTGPLHKNPRPYLVGHHIILQQHCRRHDVPLWDVRNGVPLTKRRHEGHHSRHEPIQRAELPDEIYEFLDDYPMLRRYFDKTYPEAVAA